jgi:hypothetical protein
MRKDVSFQSAGLTCRGWFYSGEGKGPRPTVVMSHGITKGTYLASYAERFSAEGFGSGVRLSPFGRDGANPATRPIFNMKTFVPRSLMSVAAGSGRRAHCTLGTSFSGARPVRRRLDPRVKAIVVQVPALNVPHS